jgi:hypothetical protein
MTCKHDFQIKQRTTNRNSLLEYDIRNIVAMVREPIMLRKLLEDFFMYQQLVILMRTLEMESFLEFHVHFLKT